MARLVSQAVPKSSPAVRIAWETCGRADPCCFVSSSTACPACPRATSPGWFTGRLAKAAWPSPEVVRPSRASAKTGASERSVSMRRSPWATWTSKGVASKEVSAWARPAKRRAIPKPRSCRWSSIQGSRVELVKFHVQPCGGDPQPSGGLGTRAAAFTQGLKNIGPSHLRQGWVGLDLSRVSFAF